MVNARACLERYGKIVIEYKDNSKFYLFELNEREGVVQEAEYASKEEVELNLVVSNLSLFDVIYESIDIKIFPVLKSDI